MSADAATLKCPNCGAPATAHASHCEYCRARLASISCPACFGLIFEGVAFCQHCGAARSRSEASDTRPVKCPACQGQMTWARVGDADLLECGTCEGTWVEAATFERICASRESQAAVLHTTRETPQPQTHLRQGYGGQATDTAARLPPVRYRPCPRCGKMMNRVNFGKISGAVVDVCKGHGTFLDRGELHQIVRFIQSGGIDRARAAEREEIVEEQRRLRDLERMHARVAPEGIGWSHTSATNDPLAAFLAVLLDRK